MYKDVGFKRTLLESFRKMIMIKEFLIVILIVHSIHCNGQCNTKTFEDESDCNGKVVADTCICLNRKSKNKPYSRLRCKPDVCYEVGVRFSNVSLISIDLKKQTFTFKFHFSIQWQDKRVERSSTCQDAILATGDMDQFWIPKLYVKNQIDVESKSVLGNVKDLKIRKEKEPNGKEGCLDLVQYSSVAKFEIACKMVFDDFPFDSQKCSVEVCT